jgi:hypothetical protein
MQLSKEQKAIIESFVTKNQSLADTKKQEIIAFLQQKESVAVSATTEIIVEAPVIDVEPIKKSKRKHKVQPLKEALYISPDMNAIVQLILNDNNFAWQLSEKIKVNKGDKGDPGIPGRDGAIGPAGKDGIGTPGEKGNSVTVEEVLNTLFENEEFVNKLKLFINTNSSNSSHWTLPGGGLGEQDVRVITKEYTEFHNFGSIDQVSSFDEILIYDVETNSYRKITFEDFNSSLSGISISADAGVNTINGLSGNIIISATGTNSLVLVGNTIVVSGSGGSGTVSGSYVRTIRGLSGDVNLSAGSNVTITTDGNTIIISSSGSSTSAGVATINSIDGSVIISAGPNINITNIGKVITISASAGSSQSNSYFPSGW